MKKTPATWLTVPDDALAIFGAVLVAIVLNFAVEYFTGFHTGTLQESAPIHYTRTTAEQATAAPVRPDRAEVNNERALVALEQILDYQLFAKYHQQ